MVQDLKEKDLASSLYTKWKELKQELVNQQGQQLQPRKRKKELSPFTLSRQKEMGT